MDEEKADLEELIELAKRLAQVSNRMRERAQMDEGIADPEDPANLEQRLLADVVLDGLYDVIYGLEGKLEMEALYRLTDLSYGEERARNADCA